MAVESDVVIRNYSTGQNAIWVMGTTGNVTSTIGLPPTTDTTWNIAGPH